MAVWARPWAILKLSGASRAARVNDGIARAALLLSPLHEPLHCHKPGIVRRALQRCGQNRSKRSFTRRLV